MRVLFLSILVASSVGVAFAQSLVVHPFRGADTGLGGLVADRVAEGFEGRVDEVFGPATAPGLIPPVPYDGGYLAPTAFLGEGGLATLHGAAVARAALGADLLVTGRLEDTDPLRLEAVAVFADGRTRTRTFTAAPERPATLARYVSAWIASGLEVAPPDAPEPIDLSGRDGATARALALIGGGFLDEAEELLSRAEGADDLTPRARSLWDTVRAVASGETPPDPALGAVLTLSRVEGDMGEALAAFERFAGASELPAVHAWRVALAHEAGDLGAAEDAAATAAEAYPYGAAARTGLALERGRSGAAERLAALARTRDSAALLVASAWAQVRERPEVERLALEGLGRAAPTFPYPFERASFLAFDRDDPLVAAQALSVAVRLAPENDLYWTNLGWAWYLLGFWERSVEASRRALELAPSQTIAAYNLGLVHARQGRLEAALEPYREALSRDAEVHDEAVVDVADALKEEPDEAALHFVHGLLLAADGQRSEAAEAYRRAGEAGLPEPYGAQAAERAERLAAPPPPLNLPRGVTLRLGSSGFEAAPWHPGDPVAPRFEITTPGEALPRRVDVTVIVRDGEGGEVTRREAAVEVPANAIGFVVDEVTVELPRDLQPGDYALEVRVGAPEQEVRASTELLVEGEPQPLRRLAGRGVRLTPLQGGSPLFEPGDVARPEAVVERLVEALRTSASAAEEALPAVEEGRFAGLTGGAVFAESDASDVRDFLAHLATQEVSDTRLTFVDAYAQWAVDGAPAP